MRDRVLRWLYRRLADRFGECRHSWTNWSAPGEATATERAPWGGVLSQRTIQAQARRCFHCNQYEYRKVETVD